jgi:predicted Zn-dependent protease
MSRILVSKRLLPVNFVSVAVLALLAFAALSCSINPVSGRNQIILMSEEKEQEIGDQASQQIAAQMGLLEDAELLSYVRAIGGRLAELAPRRDIEYTFNIVDLPEPNAFALPGGYVYVSRGLIALANSEAELANVIGHEIGHVAARHAAQRDTFAKIATIASVLGTVAAAATGEGSAAGASQYFAPIAIAAYSREQERQSDLIAQDLCARAGIDPEGMATFLHQLDFMTRFTTGASRSIGWLDTHPATPERVAEASTRAQVLRWQPDFAIAATRQEYLRKIEDMVIGTRAAEGIFVDDFFLHADMGFALRFPSGWRHRNEHSRVIAVSSAGDALVMLELQGSGQDPRAAAVEFARELDAELRDGRAVRVGGFAAFRARARVKTSSGRVDGLVTWIARNGLILRLTAGSGGGNYERYEGIFRSFSSGLRPLRPEDLEKIDELRLRIVAAEAGETLAELSERAGNDWSLNETAVANAMFDREPLAHGTLVKIAVRQRYVARPPSELSASELPSGPLLGPLRRP